MTISPEGINCPVKYADGRLLVINSVILVNYLKGPYVAQSGANYVSAGADYTVPPDNVLYAPWIYIGPPPTVNSQNIVNWQIYIDGSAVATGIAVAAPIPVDIYAPPGSKLQLYIRTMATDVGVEPTLHCSIPQYLLDAVNDIWSWKTVVGVANPVDPATLTWET